MYQMLFLFFLFLKNLNYWLFLFQGQIRFHHFPSPFPGFFFPPPPTGRKNTGPPPKLW